MRCITLAGALTKRGWDCAFASAPGSDRTVPTLRQAGVPVLAIEGTPTREAEVIRSVFDRPADLLVIDHPTYQADEERAFRAAAKARLAIDSRFRAHDVEAWLDLAPGRDLAQLKKLAVGDCMILAGKDYAPIDPMLLFRREESLHRREQAGFAIQQLMINFGAGDHWPAFEASLRAIAAIDRTLPVTVVAGGAEENCRLAIRKLGLLRAKLMTWTNDIGALMAAADVMIGAAGATAWERCCLGLPSLILTAAADQAATAAHLDQAGAAIHLGAAGEVTPERITETLQGLRSDRDRMRMLSQTAAAEIDGAGADRVAAALDRFKQPAMARTVAG